MQYQALVGLKHTLSTFVNTTSQTAAYLDIGAADPYGCCTVSSEKRLAGCH